MTRPFWRPPAGRPTLATLVGVLERGDPDDRRLAARLLLIALAQDADFQHVLRGLGAWRSFHLAAEHLIARGDLQP